MVVLGFVLSLAAMVLQGPGLVTGWRLGWRFAHTTGDVLAVRVEHPGTKQQIIVADYVFAVAGAERQVTESVTSGFKVSQKMLGPVVVHYLPDDPTVSEIIPGSRFAGSLTGMGITFAVLFYFAAAWGNRDAKAKARIAFGKVAEQRPASVLDHERVCQNRFQRKLYRLVWRDRNGATGHGVWIGSAKHLPPVGSTITIYADPTGKFPPVWEGDCGPN